LEYSVTAVAFLAEVLEGEEVQVCCNLEMQLFREAEKYHAERYQR
jgi:hypothetical protein